jgi:hypothetical protein
MSKEHLREPFVLELDGELHTVGYEPAESQSGLFGGNSNWRGPVWLPINYLLITSLRKYYDFYGDKLRVSCPTGSAQKATLAQVASTIACRLQRLFLRNPETNERPFYGGVDYLQTDEHWRDHVLFYEYFHGDNGAGIGASHQTGWTALIASLIQEEAQSAQGLDAAT